MFILFEIHSYLMPPHFFSTLKSVIDVGQGISVGPGRFGKKNKRRALNKRRAWKIWKKDFECYKCNPLAKIEITYP